MRRTEAAERRHDIRMGLVTLGILCVALALVFGVRPPQPDHGITFDVLVPLDVRVGVDSPVRIAGVQVGAVTKVQRAEQMGRVTMHVQPEGLPLHQDLSGRIRPRLFLEGNYYIDLQPGTPSAPTLRDGASLPAGTVTGAVQLDRVLSDLRQPERTSIRGLFQGFGNAVGTPSSPGGETAGQSLNRSLDNSPQALRSTAIVTTALQGTAPDSDLPRLVDGLGDAFDGLAADPARLTGLVRHLNGTLAAFADRPVQLQQTITGLDDVARAAVPALDKLDASLPSLARFARQLTPGIRQLPAASPVLRPWLLELERLFGEDELGGVARDLAPTVAQTAAGLTDLRRLTLQLDGVNKCLLNKALPVAKSAVDDGSLSTGVDVWTEGLQGFVGLAGAAQGFDANGAFLRGQTGGGTVPVKTSDLPDQGPAFGNAVAEPQGTRPAYPGKAPAVRTDASCAGKAPSLKAKTGVGP